ncbi:DegT/DnrJ/EryC1/StrS family aminotransferase [Mariniphaga sediminis]|uniref:DegT/DnrJ/EryC1/StrS family aminotransferase n=1 Tax=Mariniphaga sediminis TaxID=1628158 RepID=A0A399CR89_9BACT|nr:DegT/DnrJ/EryC1/StrS family aminotransferase [Mariniphaga sediminis]RIH62735.1 DegT/DnrJ/EryC1/StrS family aminotransferase [Mariniphaga sediminis]
MTANLNRRNFIRNSAISGIGLTLGAAHTSFASGPTPVKPVVLGGEKAHTGVFPSWPVFDQKEEKALNDVLQSKNWCRLGSTKVDNFEAQYKKLNGAKHCLATSSGTSSLSTMLGALDVGPGDEVVIPVYTFIATYNVVTLNYALPIFVDSDIESFQIDANKIEPAITKQTKVIMPVHIGGSPADLDKILSIGEKTKLPIIEDACQAHLAEWKGKKVGNFGLGGAFSFQASKNLNSGEGGAIITNDDSFAQTCYNFHNQGQGGRVTGFNPGSGTRGTNLRLTEFQGNLLVAQMTRVVEQTNRRYENARYLSKLLNDIPGITPAKLYEGTTLSAYHLYMFRYDKSFFDGLSRSKFIEALKQEGIPCSKGYGMINKDAYVTGLVKNKHYLKIYGEKTMNDWLERNQCPQNDKLTGEESLWFFQYMLLGSKTDMEQIAEAIRKIQKYAPEIDKSL